MSKFLTSSKDINLINGTADLNVNSITATTTNFADGGGGGGGGGGITYDSGTFEQGNGIVFRNGTDADKVKNASGFALVNLPVIGESLLCNDIQFPNVYSAETTITENKTKLTNMSYDIPTTTTSIDGNVDMDNGDIINMTHVRTNINSTLFAGAGVVGMNIVSEAGTDIRSDNGDIRLVANGGTGQTISLLAPQVIIDGELDVDKIKNTAGTAEVEITTDGKINIDADNTITITTPMSFQQYGGNIALLSNSSILSSATTSNTIASNDDITLTTVNGGINLYTDNLCKIENVATTSGFSFNPTVPEIILKKNSTQNASFGITASNVVDLTASLPVNINSVNNTLNVEGYGAVAMSSTTADLTLSAGGSGNVLCSNTPSVDNSIVNKVYVDNKLPKTGTLAQMLALTGMSPGDQFFLNYNTGTNISSQKNKMCFWSGRTWQVIGETVELNLEMTVIKGNTMEVGTLADYAITKTTATASAKVIGVIAFEAESAGQWVTLATRGIWEVACEAGTYQRGRYLQTDTIDGLARQTIYETEQPFAKILENRTTILNDTTIWALLHTQEIY